MSEEKRSHIRLKMDAEVFVEVAAATAQAEAELARCEVVDVSFGGLQVKIEQPLLEGSILAISVDLPTMPDPFFMPAEVKWCQQERDSEQWLAGFALVSSSDSDVAAWRELLEHV